MVFRRVIYPGSLVQWAGRIALALATVTVLIAIALAGGPVEHVRAVGGPAPTLNTNNANCYRNIIETGDLYCLIRYELPTYTTASPPPGSPEAWCAELVDKDGCIADPVEPTNETSLPSDAAYVTLYQNCGADCSTGTLELQTRVPRINHSIGGAYLSAGHAVTWGDTTVNGCVESSASLYTVQSRSCLPVVWNAAATDVDSQRTQLGSDLVADLRSLEANRSLGLNSYVTNNLITTGGRILSVEALSIMDQIIPERFQAASDKTIATAYATPSSVVALQDTLDTDAALTNLPTAFVNIGALLGGISGGAMATIFFIGIGGVVFWWLFQQTSEYVIPSAGFVTVAMIGIFVRGPSVSVVAVAAVGLSFIAGMFILRKVGT